MGLVKLNDRGVRSATAFGSLNAGSMVFIKKLTSDGSDDTLSFVNGTSDVVLDSTYKEYMFIFNNIHPETDNAFFTFNLSVDAGSNYNVTKTTTFFTAYHDEADTATALAYDGDRDLAQSTDFQNININTGNANDECVSGSMTLFNPSSTTFVKHFISRAASYNGYNYINDYLVAGYGNTTSAVDAVQFKMSSDEIQAGTITLYGIK